MPCVVAVRPVDRPSFFAPTSISEPQTAKLPNDPVLRNIPQSARNEYTIVTGYEIVLEVVDGSSALAEGGGVVSVFLAFRWQSRRASVPFIPGTLWHHRSFREFPACVPSKVIVLYGVLFLLPIYWETIQHATPATAGLGLLTLPLSMMVSAPWAGRASDRYGGRRIVIVGMFLTAIGSIAVGGWPGNVADPLMIGSLIVLGIGCGFV